MNDRQSIGLVNRQIPTWYFKNGDAWLFEDGYELRDIDRVIVFMLLTSTNYHSK